MAPLVASHRSTDRETQLSLHALGHCLRKNIKGPVPLYNIIITKLDLLEMMTGMSAMAPISDIDEPLLLRNYSSAPTLRY